MEYPGDRVYSLYELPFFDATSVPRRSDRTTFVTEEVRSLRQIQDAGMTFFCRFVTFIMLVCEKLKKIKISENEENHTVSVYFPCTFDRGYHDFLRCLFYIQNHCYILLETKFGTFSLIIHSIF